MAALPAAESLSYTTYHNPRFGIRVDYPPAVLQPEAAPQNDDGRRFTSEDHRFVMTVSGRHDVRGLSSDSLLREAWADLPPDRAAPRAYEAQIGEGFVLSGAADGQVYYRRVLREDDRLLTLDLQYDATQQARYDSIATHISRSFQAIPPSAADAARDTLSDTAES